MLIFQYINLLQKEGPQEWIFRECQVCLSSDASWMWLRTGNKLQVFLFLADVIKYSSVVYLMRKQYWVFLQRHTSRLLKWVACGSSSFVVTSSCVCILFCQIHYLKSVFFCFNWLLKACVFKWDFSAYLWLLCLHALYKFSYWLN